MKEITLPAPPEKDPQESLTAEEAHVVTQDPASFLIASAVDARVRESVVELKNLITDGKPDLVFVFETVLAAMAKTKFIRILGDKIILLKTNSTMFFSKDNFSFLPKIARILSTRILQNLASGKRAPGEKIVYHTLPDHPLIQKRIDEIEKEYMKQMYELTEWSAAHPEYSADKVRMMMLINGNLDTEDF